MFECKKCKNIQTNLIVTAKCEKCDSLLEYKIPEDCLDASKFMDKFTFWRYYSLFPEIREENRLNWNEGGTPFIKAKNLAAALEISSLFLKDETKNPTNSYSDRASSLVLSYCLELGYESVICASNGNSGASVAAYSARSPLNCKIIVPKKVAIGKLAQMHIFSDNIMEAGEILDDAIQKSEEISTKEGLFQATPEINPLAIEAQATIAYEIMEKTNNTAHIDWILIPMGSGGLLWSIWKGYLTFQKLKQMDHLPHLVGIQAAGCAPIVDAFDSKQVIQTPLHPNTRALEILVTKPVWGDFALRALRESKGIAISVTDGEILEGEKILARSEGVFAESASSATIAGLKKLRETGIIDRSDNVVCLITGSGLKEPYILKALSERPKIKGQKISTKLEILRILEINESYGYKIWQDLGAIKSIQSIYQHLNELENKELVKWKLIKNKKIFEITTKGKKVLEALETLVDLL
ncbi:MAG: threonine synthase [Candidatus Helarchaeota archaeon]